MIYVIAALSFFILCSVSFKHTGDRFQSMEKLEAFRVKTDMLRDFQKDLVMRESAVQRHTVYCTVSSDQIIKCATKIQDSRYLLTNSGPMKDM